MKSLVVLTALLAVGWCMRTQGVSVTGTLMCGSSPAKNAKVRIVDLDTGTTRELTPIDPVLYIWHECKDEQTPCARKLRFEIPKKFIHGKEVEEKHWIDIGTLNLEAKFDNEARECVPTD
ncbi:hypothetical protein PFISCL1PPCAC_5804, partial [Pristionchus fissidentatus]